MTKLLASRCTFGCLKWIDANVIDLKVNLAVGCIVAETGLPLGSGAWECGADITDGSLGDPRATIAFFDNYLTAATLSGAASFFPESTFDTRKYGLALHDR